MSKGTNAWNKVVSAALKLPGVTVDRKKFLEAELGKYLSEPHLQAAIERGTIDLVKEKILDSFVKKYGEIPDEYKDAVDAVMEV